MAGDWIKLEHSTISKPEVIAMSDLLEKSPEEVFGMLFHVWCWFDKQSRDGNAGSVTGNALMRYIDHLVRRPGFAACMKQVGWLTDSGMPNFERHNGESAKKRALTKDRAKRFRNAESNAPVTQRALPEKRREEKKEITTGANAPDGFQRFWKAWPASSRKGGKSECLRRWLARGLEGSAAEIVSHVEALKSGKQWADPQFIPAPLTYLNQSRWDGAEAESARDQFEGAL